MDVNQGHEHVGSNGTLVFEVTDDELAKFASTGSSSSSSSSESKDRSTRNEQAKIAYSSELAGIEGYDPKRIPASIFTAKPANATDWSVASNESLFSIHMGNNSFSRDHLFAMYKSGELPRLDDSAVPKLKTVMESDNAGRDSAATEHESQHDREKGEIAAPFVPSDAYIRIPDGSDRKLSQDSMSSSWNSNSSSIVSFQYLLTENDKGANPSSARMVTGNQSPCHPGRQMRQHEEEHHKPSPRRSPSTALRRWVDSLRCGCMG